MATWKNHIGNRAQIDGNTNNCAPLKIITTILNIIIMIIIINIILLHIIVNIIIIII